jgi:hypothetical protein
MHWGVDEPAAPGSPVYAPESGYLVAVVQGDNISPFRGFGPSCVVLLGNSNYFHLLGHLSDAEMRWPRAHESLTRAALFSTPLTPRYRPKAYKPRLPSQPADDLHSMWGVAPGEQMPIVRVSEGELVGTVGAFYDASGNYAKQSHGGRVTWSGPHLHWEVRKRLDDRKSAIDPIAWLNGVVRKPRGGGSAALLLLLLLAASRR